MRAAPVHGLCHVLAAKLLVVAPCQQVEHVAKLERSAPLFVTLPSALVPQQLDDGIEGRVLGKAEALAEAVRVIREEKRMATLEVMVGY